MVCIAFACSLACVKGHFARLFSSLFSLSTLPLVSIWSGKYSTDWVQCDGAFGGGRSQGCHGYLLPHTSLLPGSTNLFRHQLPSSSIVDEFKLALKFELTQKYSEYQCSALPIEPSSQLGAGHSVSSISIR